MRSLQFLLGLASFEPPINVQFFIPKYFFFFFIYIVESDTAARDA